ncbi:MAG: D-alanine--D-alanine ligase family protein, partial [Treponemataceae bacterium]
MNVAIIFGGKSGEHEVSIRSATSVIRHINTKKHTPLLIGINKKGQWFLQSHSEIDRIKNDENALLTVNENDNLLALFPSGGVNKSFFLFSENKFLIVDVVFPVLHGTFGEDGTIQGLFEMLDVPYVGAGVMASSLAMDKEKTKQIWLQEHLPVVDFFVVHKNDCITEDDFEKNISTIMQKFKFPVFVKPARAGSSVGAKKACDKNELR